jgi:hypothetical protein
MKKPPELEIVRSSSNMDPLHVGKRLTWRLFQCAFCSFTCSLGVHVLTRIVINMPTNRLTFSCP